MQCQGAVQTMATTTMMRMMMMMMMMMMTEPRWVCHCCLEQKEGGCWCHSKGWAGLG
jgi:hypothetical protein